MQNDLRGYTKVTSAEVRPLFGNGTSTKLPSALITPSIACKGAFKIRS